MSLELLFNALAAIVWPILDVLLLLFGVLAVLLLCAAIVGWVVLSTPNPGAALLGKACGSRTKEAESSPDLGNHSS